MSEYAGDSEIKRADARMLVARAVEIMRAHCKRALEADVEARAGALAEHEAEMDAWREEMAECVVAALLARRGGGGCGGYA